jgi:hypothetical protein
MKNIMIQIPMNINWLDVGMGWGVIKGRLSVRNIMIALAKLFVVRSNCSCKL